MDQDDSAIRGGSRALDRLGTLPPRRSVLAVGRRRLTQAAIGGAGCVCPSSPSAAAGVRAVWDTAKATVSRCDLESDATVGLSGCSASLSGSSSSGAACAIGSRPLPKARPPLLAAPPAVHSNAQRPMTPCYPIPRNPYSNPTAQPPFGSPFRPLAGALIYCTAWPML